MNAPRPFRVEPVEFAAAREALHAVREAVFVREQGVPAGIERDALDPQCRHVLARDADGRPIGTGRLTPQRTIGRMAVLAEWRGRGVGDALLDALLAQARALGWNELSLHAQATAIAFYARHGFLPQGGRFVEAGLEHQAMARRLDAVNPVETRDAGLAAFLGVAAGTRRVLRIYSRELDPGLLDRPEALAALRRLATSGRQVRLLLQDPAAPRRALHPLIALAQRLPSAFAFRAAEDPVDLDYPAAYAVDDRDGWYFRPLGHRFDGETRLDGGGRARQLREAFDPVWERARPCGEYRALGL
ncbi:GNAT family N-acetyltransferase [Vulcaniibacterium tengchongense]|uniref:Putative GNAT family N-acyltransferase n=1 Tax=Vulcaniibacterium tengchongense TaxID=1273429 RepID=A0A3N4VNV0_9GAMM|nr:GNAT family N-acetyltransferase [Vulcaniibacterium tengchongense]RPE81519.1 putative GNAT family N-acyltransferase [Vulcaniibacterium tengchongense]